MIFNNADDIKLGASDVDRVYLGTNMVWERGSAVTAVYDLDIKNYATGDTIANNLGTGPNTFSVYTTNSSTLTDSVYKSGDAIHISNMGHIRVDYQYSNYEEWTLELIFDNFIRNSSWASRILNSGSNAFEIYYDGSSDWLAIVFTMGVTSITTLVNNASINNDTARFSDITASVLGDGNEHTVGLCCDGVNVYAIFDGTKLAYIPKSSFSPSCTMGVGTFDSWSGAGTPDMDILKFAFYDTCLY